MLSQPLQLCRDTALSRRRHAATCQDMTHKETQEALPGRSTDHTNTSPTSSPGPVTAAVAPSSDYKSIKWHHRDASPSTRSQQGPVPPAAATESCCSTPNDAGGADWSRPTSRPSLPGEGTGGLSEAVSTYSRCHKEDATTVYTQRSGFNYFVSTSLGFYCPRHLPPRASGLAGGSPRWGEASERAAGSEERPQGRSARQQCREESLGQGCREASTPRV